MNAARAPSAAALHALAAVLFLLASLALRFSTFGDTNLFVDDVFYFLVGQRMHEGVLPYVDVWDRKPLGLFAIYWAIAAISTSVVCLGARRRTTQRSVSNSATATAWLSPPTAN